MKSFEKNMSAIEAMIGYTFQNKALLEQAFTRTSYTNENQDCPSNEVLEFLGDSALGMIVAKHLSERYQTLPVQYANPAQNKPYYLCELDEAELSEYKISLVQRASLALATEKAKLERHLRMGKSDIESNVQNEPSVKEDLFEAILGAIAIDSSWNVEAMEAVVKTLLDIDQRLECYTKDDAEQEARLLEKAGAQNVVFEEALPDCPALTYGFSVTLGDTMLNETFYGYGNTPEGARKMAVQRAEKHCHIINDRATTIKNAVGEPNFDRAINQLQELAQKKIIPEPKYVFSQSNRLKNGNPQWGCRCIIEGIVNLNGDYYTESKAQSKKAAAFETLCALIGIDLIHLWIEKGTIIEDNNETD